jgi:hypothetical protein
MSRKNFYFLTKKLDRRTSQIRKVKFGLENGLNYITIDFITQPRMDHTSLT